MVATAKALTGNTVELADVYRLSVDQYDRMISPRILHDGDPLELLEGLLLHKWPARFGRSADSILVDELYPLSVEQFHEMFRLGILRDEDRLELLEGVIYKRTSILPPHTGTVIRLTDIIKPRLPVGWRYRQEQPVVLSDGEPMPDGAVATGTDEDNFCFHPLAKDVSLAIEVADTTLTRDRGPKCRSYARAGIACYWIVNLIDRQIEVHTHPNPAAEPPVYSNMQIFKPGDSVPLTIAEQTIAQIQVVELLPAV
jgi:hypothetical protein